jgi:L,D-peptidoglycan transpeptidase YkuD (ErfK/YbiS/YcfS/YnhG family)
MILVKNSGYLFFKKKKYKCAIGFAGTKKNKQEGDKATPKGIFKIIKVYYRKDKIGELTTSIEKIPIKKNMGWCDDPLSKEYNKLITIPNNASYEGLHRKDNLYDLIGVINYNTKKIIKGKGSAIFFHVAKAKYTPTQGCVALKKDDLLFLLKNVKKNNKVKII